MGRRGVLSNMPKLMVLPTVSWVAVIRLLKKGPKHLPAFGPGIAAEMAMKALLGCRTAPHTDSQRHADNYRARIKGRHGSRMRPKPSASMLPIIGSCSSRPHTDSFRVHHVVNQEALQLMLTFGDDHDADFDQAAFFVSEGRMCYGIVGDGDGDRLLHDDVYADDCARASSSISCMHTCSSSFNNSGSRSLASSTCAALSWSSVDSDGIYSTATSAASVSHTPSRVPELLNGGPHISCCYSRPSSSIASSCNASELIDYSHEHLDHDIKDEEGEVEVEVEAEVEEKDQQLRADADVVWDFNAQNDRINEQDDKHPARTSSCAAMHNLISEYVIHAVSARHGAGSKACEYDDGEELHERLHEGDGDDDEEEELQIVTEMRYSENPLEDFAQAISSLVLKQQLNEAAQLHELYWRFLRLNAPRHHHTIRLAFQHALQRLASFDPHLLHTLL